DRNARGQAFPCVITGGGNLVLLGQAFLLDVGVEVARQRGAEARQVSATVTLRDVLDETEDVLVEAVVPLQGHFDAHPIIALDVEMEDLVDRRLVGVQITHERAEAAFVLEHFIFAVALITQEDADSRVEEGQLAQSLGQDVPAEMDVLEGFRRRLEMDLGSGVLGFTDSSQWSLGNTMPVNLLPDLPATTDRQHELFRKRVHNRDADTVETAGHLVGVVIELTAGMQHGHDDFSSRHAFLVDIDRNAPAVVAHTDRLIYVDSDADVAAVASQRLVDRVVDNFEHPVLQTGSIVRITDIHAGPLAHRIEAFQHLDTRRIVRVVLAHAFTPEGPWSGVITPCST